MARKTGLAELRRMAGLEFSRAAALLLLLVDATLRLLLKRAGAFVGDGLHGLGF